MTTRAWWSEELCAPAKSAGMSSSVKRKWPACVTPVSSACNQWRGAGERKRTNNIRPELEVEAVCSDLVDRRAHYPPVQTSRSGASVFSLQQHRAGAYARIVEQDMQLCFLAVRVTTQHIPPISHTYVADTRLRNSLAAFRTEARLLRSSSRKIASLPVSSLSCAMAASAFSLLRDAM